MNLSLRPSAHAPTLDPALPYERVMVLDDSRAQRTLLCSLLKRWGYDVLSCERPEIALELLADPTITMIVSDWVMPGMDGPEFCRRARAMARESYAYILLLTSKSDKNAIAHGLDAGADDFLTKPVNGPELRARIHAGERIVAMQRELVAKNKMVSAALSEISALYDALDRDLMEAKKLQASLLQDTKRQFDTAAASFLLQSSGHVGGDLVGCFPVSDHQIGLFSLDVSGHGVTSAMMTARLAGRLTSASPEQNIALERRAGGGYAPLSPHLVAARLNRLMLEEVETDLYFTLCLVILDLPTGRISMVQAGHPHPAVQRRDGRVEFLGRGGLPVGLLPDAEYETLEAELAPGDRLLIYSDGLTECPGPQGDMLGEEGLTKILQTGRLQTGRRFLDGLLTDLQGYANGSDFPDDVSAILLEYTGAAS
ncbi:PP2C family protein-serine/threonine phosphatase [Rhodophyticola porphyridii]|uniref:Fused response regulator/phosphatase n=1 Tax=Rhodophyticola porphyridii TaxID=1852017 RepID=A0A3L9Y3C2_9RHOB|nr:SpoIIE family protein phosphatase [Rhodophyticola porphyridii]RMA42902.1 fused response regulator/phosphatase [Rhodophyticola porphyridii]